MTFSRAISRDRQLHAVWRPTLTGIGVALGVTLASASEARAALYQVDTGTAATSMTVANDGKCTLVEAVMHVNGKNNGVTYCSNLDTTSQEHRIELVQAANKPYSTNHFKITTLAITTNVRVSIKGFGGAVIDSSFGNNVYSAFVIGVKGGAANQASVFFDRVTLTNTVFSNGGRLIENYGTLQFYGSSFLNGDVSGSRHASGRGGAIYNAGLISFAENSLIKTNRAKKGGGVYNDAGLINELAVTITENYASQAGGGIYNTTSITSPVALQDNGVILTYGATITKNEAAAGGGVFNRGRVELYQSVLSQNKANGGASGEDCALGQQCDGIGGGALSMHTVNGPETRFNLSIDSDLSTNIATKVGGGVYSVGTVDLGGMTISGNEGTTGGFLYYVHSGDTTQSYCNIGASAPGGAYGPTSITGNKATLASGYSIVAGDNDGVVGNTPAPGASIVRCNFAGVDRVNLTASGNSPLTPPTATRCQPSIVDTTNSSCPQ
jgi:hypothetical protein